VIASVRFASTVIAPVVATASARAEIVGVVATVIAVAAEAVVLRSLNFLAGWRD
jgi:hypothetical protein